MNFLNEIAGEYPNAVSFASGRPADAFFNLKRWLDAIPRYVGLVDGEGSNGLERLLAQYGRTNGLINELVAEQLLRDEGLRCQASHVVITAGCQEALALTLQSLCTMPGDVVLARNPTYIGVTGVADLFGIEIAPIDCPGESGLVDALQVAIGKVRAQGKNPKAFYVIPDFDNPTGTVLSVSVRRSILRLCAEQRIVILEDNAYGMFRYEGDRCPPIAAMDDFGSTIYLGTYSKTLCPSVRVGCAVVPEKLFGDSELSREMLDQLAQRKSFLTVNTSQFNQAMVGGVLLEEDRSLKRIVQPALELYKSNLETLTRCLTAAFAGYSDQFRWNVPEGGFFVSMELPFAFGAEEVLLCARKHHVIPMPMSFFSLDGTQTHRIRIAFSNVAGEQINVGVERLAQFLLERVSTRLR
jgi:(S)-3,5-dihydroxyphenylglycine transaminase